MALTVAKISWCKKSTYTAFFMVSPEVLGVQNIVSKSLVFLLGFLLNLFLPRLKIFVL